MTFAAIGDTPYNIMLLIHIASGLIAFAPAFVNPLLLSSLDDAPADQRSQIAATMHRNSLRLYAPALIVTGLIGFGLAGLSDQVFRVRQGWLIAAVLIWIAMNGILHALIIPAERGLAAGDWSQRRRLDLAGPAITLLLVVMLWLMIWKPGL